jgi:hypothetical protein
MVVQQATGEIPNEEPEGPAKNQAAVTLGRLGGLKGGKARADALSPTKRKAIAKKAAEARWGRTYPLGGLLALSHIISEVEN